MITIASELLIGPDSAADRLRVAVLSEHIRPVELDADLPARELYALQLSRHLARLGVPTDLFVRRLSPDDERITEVEPGFRLVTVPAGPAAPRARRTLWMIAPQVRDQVLRFMVAEGIRYDVLHAATWVAGAAAMDAAERAGIHYTQLMQAANPAKEHRLDDPAASPPQRVQYEQEFCRAAATLIARTPSERQAIIEAYRPDPARVAVVPWGVDLERFRPLDRAAARRRLRLDPSGPVILHAGRPLARSGVHDLLRALALIEDLPGPAPLLLVAGGDTRDPDPRQSRELGELWQLAAELGIADRVRFVGRRARRELPLYYAAADVVACVPWGEPYGAVAREALACGRPVVATAVGGLADLLETQEAGLLVPPEDPRALAARLRRLLRSPGLRARLGRAGRAQAERELGWERVAARSLAVFEKAAGLPVRPPGRQPARGYSVSSERRPPA